MDEEPDLKRRRKRPKPPAQIDRLPPHSPEAEQGIIGCILADYKTCLPQCIAAAGQIGAAVFYDLRHQYIFETMCQMTGAIDVITLQQALKDKDLLDQVGGIPYLVACSDAITSTGMLDEYIGIVLEKHMLRRGIQVATEFVSSVYESESTVQEIIDKAERDILSIRGVQTKNRVPIKEAVKKAIETIEDYHERRGRIIGLSSGFIDLDKMTGGFMPGEMIVIAARPSMGKTSLCMNLVEHLAIDNKIPVGVQSLEMTTNALVMRMLCSRARVNLRNIRDGFMAERDYPRLTGATGKIASAPIYIDDSTGINAMQFRAITRRMVQEHGIKLMVLDYLQLLTATIGRKRIENRQQEISEISSTIKSTAKDLGIPIIAISQLSRLLDKENRKPRLSDLRESGSLEQDADFVGLLYRPKKDEEDDSQDDDAVPMNLLIGKQRNGPCGDVHLTFLKPFTRFESAAKVTDEDVNPSLPY